MEELPDHLVEEVLAHLPESAVLAFGATCRAYQRLAAATLRRGAFRPDLEDAFVQDVHRLLTTDRVLPRPESWLTTVFSYGYPLPWNYARVYLAEPSRVIYPLDNPIWHANGPQEFVFTCIELVGLGPDPAGFRFRAFLAHDGIDEIPADHPLVRGPARTSPDHWCEEEDRWYACSALAATWYAHATDTGWLGPEAPLPPIRAFARGAYQAARAFIGCGEHATN